MNDEMREALLDLITAAKFEGAGIACESTTATDRQVREQRTEDCIERVQAAYQLQQRRVEELEKELEYVQGGLAILCGSIQDKLTKDKS